jgi:hypothetical protein
VVVVRGGVEPPTFRFSGGLARPGQSTTAQLARPDGASAVPTVQDQPHVSTAVVSTALARPTRVASSSEDRALSRSVSAQSVDFSYHSFGLRVSGGCSKLCCRFFCSAFSRCTSSTKSASLSGSPLASLYRATPTSAASHSVSIASAVCCK